MNETNPNTISHDAMLVLSASSGLVEGSYAHLLENIEKSNLEKPLPFYILRRSKSVLLNTNREIKNVVEEIANVVDYFRNYLMVDKLTILAFEEGSLLLLRTLASIHHDAFHILHALVLINAFNPMLTIYHSNPKPFLQEIKDLYAADASRLQLLNSTRMIFVNTLDENMGNHQHLNMLLELQTGEKISFANTAVVSSKFMWNVYSYLNQDEYFRFEPFVWILTKMFNQDRENGPLSIKDIEYILLYRELPIQKSLSMLTRRKMMKTCHDVYLQSYKYDGLSFSDECIRVLRKENAYFNKQTAIVIAGEGKFEVYGEAFEKIAPYDTKMQEIIYLLENVEEYKRFFIINRKRINLRITIHGTILSESRLAGFRLEDLGMYDLEYRFYFIRNSTRKEVMRVCPGGTLIFPHHFGPRNNWDHRLYLELIGLEHGFCYKANDFLMLWFDEIIIHWSFALNMAIFTLFCTHVTQNSTFSRFYIQYIINQIITLLTIGDFLPFENMVLLGMIVMLQLILKSLIWISDLINVPKSFIAKFLWLPLIFEAVKYIHPSACPSAWKVLGLQFISVLHKKNIFILFIESIFLVEYIVKDLDNTFGLSMICIWILIATPNDEDKKEEAHGTHSNITVINTHKLNTLKATILRFRNQLVDTITACVLVFCINEAGVILHHVIDFYIITYGLFVLHELCSDYLS